MSRTLSRPKASIFLVVPAKAGTHLSASRAFARWIPAFAGMTILEESIARRLFPEPVNGGEHGVGQGLAVGKALHQGAGQHHRDVEARDCGGILKSSTVSYQGRNNRTTRESRPSSSANHRALLIKSLMIGRSPGSAQRRPAR